MKKTVIFIRPQRYISMHKTESIDILFEGVKSAPNKNLTIGNYMLNFT